MKKGRVLAAAFGALLVAGLGLVLVGYAEATSTPLVRNLTLRPADYPSNAAPVRIVLISDLHVHGPDMPPSRVARIVDQVNGLRPDVVILGGDFVGDNWIGASYSIRDAIAPLARLKPKIGVYAVFGNNDYDAGASEVGRALTKAGVRVLVNQAVRAGPIAIGGIDGEITIPRAFWKTRREETFAALQRLPGAKILVAHRPDEFHWSPPWIDLVLAGHTHCGQIVLPFIGPMETGSDFGTKYLCGLVRDGSRALIVTAGVGTSHVPLRIGAVPDIWVIELR